MGYEPPLVPASVCCARRVCSQQSLHAKKIVFTAKPISHVVAEVQKLWTSPFTSRPWTRNLMSFFTNPQNPRVTCNVIINFRDIAFSQQFAAKFHAVRTTVPSQFAQVAPVKVLAGPDSAESTALLRTSRIFTLIRATRPTLVSCVFPDNL